MKQWFKKWTEQSAEHFLCDPITHGGDAQGAEFSASLVDVRPSHG